MKAAARIASSITSVYLAGAEQALEARYPG
jgi:hypothetical protein